MARPSYHILMFAGFIKGRAIPFVITYIIWQLYIWPFHATLASLNRLSEKWLPTTSFWMSASGCNYPSFIVPYCRRRVCVLLLQCTRRWRTQPQLVKKRYYQRRRLPASDMLVYCNVPDSLVAVYEKPFECFRRRLMTRRLPRASARRSLRRGGDIDSRIFRRLWLF